MKISDIISYVLAETGIVLRANIPEVNHVRHAGLNLSQSTVCGEKLMFLYNGDEITTLTECLRDMDFPGVYFEHGDPIATYLGQNKGRPAYNIELQVFS